MDINIKTSDIILIAAADSTEHDTFQCVSIICQLQHQDTLLHRFRTILLVLAGLQHKALLNATKIDGKRFSLVGGDQPEFIILGRILQFIGHTFPIVGKTVVTLKLDTHPSFVFDGRENASETLDVAGILKEVTIVITVVIYKGIRWV